MKTSIIEAVKALEEGQYVPENRFPEDWVRDMLDGGGVTCAVSGSSRSSRSSGSRRALRVVSPIAFDAFLKGRGLDPAYLAETLESMHDPDSRARLVQLTGDSKVVPVRSCPGFPVNVVAPLRVLVGQRKILLCPCPGTFLYVSDFQHFRIPRETLVVGVENMENFRLPERQAQLMDQIREQHGGEPPLLLVSRYPQSRDLITWLRAIPNRYVHFGDFDLAGIHIYQSEFYQHLGPERAFFFVPDDIEDRLSRGSADRYETQLRKFGRLAVQDARLKPLVALIHRFRKGYDQEGFIAPACP